MPDINIAILISHAFESTLALPYPHAVTHHPYWNSPNILQLESLLDFTTILSGKLAMDC